MKEAKRQQVTGHCLRHQCPHVIKASKALPLPCVRAYTYTISISRACKINKREGIESLGTRLRLTHPILVILFFLPLPSSELMYLPLRLAVLGLYFVYHSCSHSVYWHHLHFETMTSWNPPILLPSTGPARPEFILWQLSNFSQNTRSYSLPIHAKCRNITSQIRILGVRKCAPS